MATEQKEEMLVDMQQAYSKTEKYIEENKKSLTIILGGILLVIGGYFAWDRLYVQPQEEEAVASMFYAQQYFESDSLNKAIKGDGQHKGFVAIADEFSVTKSANLAHYYLGICYLRTGKFEDAITELKQFDTDNAILAPVATGAMGDANMELGKTEDAISFYLKAAKIGDNKFTTPIYLMKAAGAYEDAKNFENAIKIYEQIKTDFPNTNEGREIEKYISRALTLKGA
jgi:tetratricopeptide (TPR) repeat protein